MKHVCINEISVQNFRIHKDFRCKIDHNNVILIGHNGSGKTSILEAITLLSPGKGMLSANANEFNHEGSEKSVIIAGLNDGTKIQIDNKINNRSNTKNIFVNDKLINKQIDLVKWCDVIWFTSETQYSFLQSSANRRKFFDRMIFALFNNHVSLLNDYDKLIKERMKILQIGTNNAKWLDAIEKQITGVAIGIEKNRANFAENCNTEMANNALPHVKITKQGSTNLDFQDILLHSRARDRESGRTNNGPHRDDFLIIDEKEGRDITLVSSGRQKMFLLSVFECFARLLSVTTQRTPIILFDEISSFIDHNNFDKIMHSFTQNDAQIWMSSPRKYDLFDKYDTQIVNL